MNCEEFELIGLDGGADSPTSITQRIAAQNHANSCSRCAALLESWLAAKAELNDLGELTRAAETPSRVEMRLRQEFRMRHRAVPARRAAMIAAWALAAAAVVVGAVSWRNWEETRRRGATKHELIVPNANQNQAQNNASAMLTIGDDEGEFTLVPGSAPSDTEDAAIWRVQMQRGALGALGLPVNEERVGDVILVDLLVGEDGLPQAVKLVE
jgi:hypothetical protein